MSQIHAASAHVRAQALQTAQKKAQQAASARIALFLLGCLSAVVVAFGNLTLLIPGALLLLFAIATIHHDRLDRRVAHAQDALAYHQHAILREEGKAPKGTPDGLAWLPPEHTYALDLELVGPSSLFVRLCKANTNAGRKRLAMWLLHPASPETIQARQASVEELRTNFDLHTNFFIATSRQPELLTAPPSSDTPPHPTWWHALLLAMSASICVIPLAWAQGAPWAPWAMLLTSIALIASYIHMAPVLSSVRARGALSSTLDAMVQLLEHLESMDAQSPWMRERLRHFQDEKHPASREVQKLSSSMRTYEWLYNPIFGPLGLLLAWPIHLALIQERWTARNAQNLNAWNDAIADIEAMMSLSAFAMERPDAHIPTIISGTPQLHLTEFRHPLMAHDACTPHSLKLGPEQRLLLLSGSNMSGKSTLLRALGANVALAMAGGPVTASSMTWTPLLPGATLRVQDSRADGHSRFYAELERLKSLLETQDPPLLFLIDEILHGTNSHDRRLGARAYLEKLLDTTQAIGVVTTHDLAIAEAFSQDPRIVLMHLRDQTTEDGTLLFDYKLRPGPILESNALVWMKALGLL